jgi:hypothetical protein
MIARTATQRNAPAIPVTTEAARATGKFGAKA